MKELTAEQEKILKAYVTLAKKLKFHPTFEQMKDVGFTRDKIRHHWSRLGKLKREAKLRFANDFVGIMDEELYNPKQFQRLQDKVGKRDVFVITTAVAGCKVHPGFKKTLQAYAKKNDAMILVLPCSDPASRFSQMGQLHSSALSLGEVVFGDLALNSNFFVNSIKLSAKHIDPTTGLARIGQRNGSFVYASPKQFLKMVATGNSKLPHAIMTTGACTKPGYESTMYLSERTAYIAEHDHVLGAIIVEIEDDEIYHFRQIQADKSGGFVDLGVYYQGEGRSKLNPEAFIMGDLHAGETDEIALKCWKEVMQQLSPKYLVLHDAFNGKAISHHEEKRKVYRARLAEKNKLSLEAELKEYTNTLNGLAAYAEEIVITKSNHDEFLDRYLDEMRFKEDPQNLRLALTLAGALCDGLDPLKFAAERFGLKNPKKFKYLKRDDDFYIARIQCGAHGDKGANGARGTLRAMEDAYSNSVTGHSHTPGINRGAWSVGTTSLLKLDYNEGPSSWFHTSCLIYPNGARQLINVVDGRWRRKA